MNKSGFLIKFFAALVVTILAISCDSSDGGSDDGSDGGGGTTNPVQIVASIIYPTENAIDVPVNTSSIRLDFNVPVDESSITTADLLVSPPLNGNVNVISTTEFEFIPSHDLSSNTLYTFTLTGVDASNGSTLASTIWSFTTGDVQVNRATFFMSPIGNDSNSGSSRSLPWLSFEHAFSTMASGDELILLDGDYSVENGNGIMRDVGSYGETIDYSKAIPSGKSLDWQTIVRAEVPGNVRVLEYISNSVPDGHGKPLSIGRTSRKDSYITVNGIYFEGGGHLFNSQYISIKNSGFHGGFRVGTSDHDNGNSYNLIEDVWIWAENTRIIAINYRSHNNVWRRVLVRSEGCDDPGCESYPKEDPSVGITVYDSHDVSMQNIIVIDRLLRNDVPYADFATAQHTSDTQYHLGRNEWLGCLSINSDDSSLNFEADNVLNVIGDNLIWSLNNFISLGSPSGGVNLGNTPYNYQSMGEPPSSIENVSVFMAGDVSDNKSAIRVSPSQYNVITESSLTVGATRAGYNQIGSSVVDSVAYNPVASEGDFDVRSCTQCISLSFNPLSDGSVLFPLKVEAGSELATAITDITPGAEVLKRYGENGTKWGDTDYNLLTSNDLWPWPNEDRIKKDLCTDAGVIRGFCSEGKRLDGENPVTLTSYIWESLGNPIPVHIYGN